ncbi:flagellar protein FliT [Pseudomonas sp. TTU2014-080ASC]|uniref:flagellar protein FliT n=1 Tax=Pseudomonas sp. TTU2014-080ASC TaxID=1729724 RepID=UPI000718899E|nr:flagellar protein FliT [Pseudomonas sp. TTU2014-080ASC]KRW62239.1 flagellar assembly protein FliT [Pseudomonas sp. TTU2014-080ASC]
MSTSVQRLEETGSALRQALASRDWAAIGELDLQCRQAVDDVMVESVADEALLRARMQELLDLYRELVNLCQVEQRRLAQEMVQLNQSKQSAKVYQFLS